MKRTLIHLAMFPAAILAVSVARAADDDDVVDTGITEYENACMPCHGVNGHGNGPKAAALPKPPADLTQISKTNGGTFPAAKVAEIIDGRAEVRAHGLREMPVWGDRYRLKTDPSETPKVIDKRARTQIEALVDYIASIQE